MISNSPPEKYFEFSKHIEKCNSEGALSCLESLKEAAGSGNCQACMWILERRFPDDFVRGKYKKIYK